LQHKRNPIFLTILRRNGGKISADSKQRR